MEEDANNNGGLRPISQPNLASRFPSLRRLNSSEPYRHRSLPAEPSSGSDGGSETTFAVLYDDGPDYHVGHYDEAGSMGTNTRPDSQTSFAPSFRTRDSRVFSDDHDIDRNPDLLANQRLLAEGYMNNTHDPYMDNPSPAYNMYSQETLTTQNTYANAYPNEKVGLHMPAERPVSAHSHQSWCTCDDDHGHGGGPKGPSYDVEAQKEPSTPTPLMSEEKEKKGPPGGGPGAGGPGPKGPGGPGAGGPPPGGPPGLPPFPPGFPDHLKVRSRYFHFLQKLTCHRLHSMALTIS